MSARDEQAVRLIVAKVLADLLSASDRAVRNDVVREWVIGDRINGLISDSPAGAVQVKKGATRAAVTDPVAFQEWVKENRPTEWETVTPAPFQRVRPAFVTAVVEAARKTGLAVTKDGEEIPGVTVSQADPTVSVTLDERATELVAAAWETGELWAIVGSLLPQLEAGEPSE